MNINEIMDRDFRDAEKTATAHGVHSNERKSGMKALPLIAIIVGSLGVIVGSARLGSVRAEMYEAEAGMREARINRLGVELAIAAGDVLRELALASQGCGGGVEKVGELRSRIWLIREELREMGIVADEDGKEAR